MPTRPLRASAGDTRFRGSGRGENRDSDQAGQRRAARQARARRRRNRRRLFLVVVICIAAAAIGLVTRPKGPTLTPLEARIVELAERQVGYVTDPSNSYCNRYSAYWQSGLADCGGSLRDEQWCADFAAWVWKQSGVRFTYALQQGDINAAAISFYYWGVAHHTWHRATTSYLPKPGDVAVYGLDLASGVAEHVAVVTAMASGARGPDVINGDGSRTGFSVVEPGADQYKADIKGNGGQLAGYVSPVRAVTA